MKNLYLVPIVAVMVLAGAGCKHQENIGNSQPENISTKRVLIASGYAEKNREQLCKEKFNTDKPNATVKYSDKEAGFEVLLPYNEKWGNEKYELPPYAPYQSGGTIEFGPIYSGVFEATCFAKRSLLFNVMPAHTVAEITPEETSELKPVVMKINGLTVVKFEYPGMCTGWDYEVIGKKHNYRFSSACGPEEDQQVLENTIKTLTFIN